MSQAREKIIINDVGPRDGLQNQAKILSPAERVQLIQALIAAGINNIEIGSFVSPKAVPAMAGAGDVFAGLPTGDQYNFSALIPNRRGYDLAKASGVKTMGMVIAASETMNNKNINMSNEQALAVTAEILAQAKEDGLSVLAYIATAWECPFEGAIAESTVLELCGKLIDLGATEVSFADTIGAATPAQAKSIMSEAVSQFGAEKVFCHFHDTRAMGVANVFAAVEAGVRKFDSSIGGLGGCPFAPGATGNVATEDVVLMLEQMGFDTGIELGKLLKATSLAAELTQNCDGGHANRWIQRQVEKGLLAA